MKIKHLLLFALIPTFLVMGCVSKKDGSAKKKKSDGDWKWVTEQFADIRIIRYKVPGFDELSLQKKTLLYYLSEAAACGRDMIYDQNYKHNIRIRRTLENVYKTYSGKRTGDDWVAFHTYLKRVWFSNGIHHHYSSKKIMPGFSEAYFDELIANSAQDKFPRDRGQSVADLVTMLKPILFDPKVDFKRVNKDKGVDLAAASANNFYDGVTQKDVEKYYAERIDPKDKSPISWGLNSQMAKSGPNTIERVWKVGGMYGQSIEQIVSWLKKASGVAEGPEQKAAIDLLVQFYETGDLKKFDEYNIAWVKDTESEIDFINGFIEVYGDALGYRASYESVVQLTDPVASKRIKAISERAQWFEDNSPIMDEHKKAKVKGISAKVINVVMESGDASPSTPIGINLPNANWIRSNHGSKSVNLANIVEAYGQASKSSGVLEEFAYNQDEVVLARKYGGLPDNLHTDMHEVIGHASGKINPGVSEPHTTLKSYASTLEEARADLVALYYLYDQKLVEIGLMPSIEVGKAHFNDYIRNGMMLQLRRLEVGEDIEEDHMRNRQLICKWVIEKGAKDNVVEKKMRDGKTFFIINDYKKLQFLFGELLKEIQRIKSEGDYNSAKALVEGYGVKVDPKLHQEVLDRVEKLHIAPYSGFINPVLVPVVDGSGSISDVKVTYPDDFTEQHLYYADKYSFLPNKN